MNASQSFLLAIDLGTSGPKVGLFTAQGDLVAYEYQPVPLHLLLGGGAEQAPADWWQAICTATRRLLAQRLVPVERILALCCTSQWSGTVAVDAEGQPLMNAIIWLDTRGAPYIRRALRGFPEVQGYNLGKLLAWLRLTAGVPGQAGKDSIAHILYIRHEYAEIYRHTFKFLEPKDYINLRLTGKFAASYDSIALHWVTDNRDLRRVDYSPRLLRLVGLEREKLPDLKRAVDILGTLTPQAAEELGLPPSVQVVMGTPDLQSAALGSGAAGDFEAHLYIGTSSWIACHVPFKKTDLLHGICSLPSAIPNRYLVADEQETAGACLTFLRDNILFHTDELLTQAATSEIYQIFDRMAARAPAGSGGLIFTPWLYGERTPVDDRNLRGAWFNLSLRTTREHLIRAIYEGVAYNTRWLLGYVEKFVGRCFQALNVVGGGAKSEIWSQILADVLERPIRQVKDPILANVRGAAYLAAVALGVLKFEDLSGRTPIAHTYTPNPDTRPIYRALFREFLEIYRRCAPLYARLNRGPEFEAS